MTKLAKKIITKLVMLMVVCSLMMLSCAAAFADGETRTICGETRRAYWRGQGNGSEISIFQVAVQNAPATVYFEQEEGLCYEVSHTHVFDGPSGKEEEWGKYHVFYKLAGTNQIQYVNWDKTNRGGEFELYLNNTGVYYVWVVPYTAQEMTDSWLLDRFQSWNRTPRWWISGISSGSNWNALPYQLEPNGRINYNKPLNLTQIIPEM